MKKILSLVLALALTLALGIPALAADAEEALPQITLTASADKAAAGKTVTLTLALTGALTDISSFEYYIHYDPTVVTLTGSKTGAASDLVKIGTPPDANYAKTEKNAAVTVSAVKLADNGKFTMSAGTVAELTFTVNADAAEAASAGFALEKLAVCDSTFAENAVPVKTETAPVVTVGSDILLGDVNGDGEVNHRDASKVYDYYNGIIELTEEQLAAADVNGDGEVNHRDASKIYDLYNGVIDNF